MNLSLEAARGRCRNCDAPLPGPYCAECGQEAHGSARSLATLLHDVWHDLTHLDGRLWRTVGALAFRPGHLTAEYLADRRARYLPPFRVYLVLSIAFFALAASETNGPQRAVLVSRGGVTLYEGGPEIERAVRQLEAEGQGAFAAALRGAASRGAPDPADVDRVCGDLTRRGGARFGPALAEACRRNVADGGRALVHAFLANVPKTMFLFLPIVALVAFALFGRSRRFYVEHLVLVLHLQSAMFLLACLGLAAGAAERWGPTAKALGDLVTLALWIYAVWYAQRCLRVAYGEGRAATAAKLAVLGLAYGVLLGVTLVGTALWSVATA